MFILKLKFNFVALSELSICMIFAKTLTKKNFVKLSKSPEKNPRFIFFSAPCIIFIDEIDSVGSKRVSNSIHPYANQTINQLLR